MEGSLGWRKTEWTRFDQISHWISQRDKRLLVLTRIFSTCRRHWAMTMWLKLSSTLPRGTLPKVLEGNLVFRKTVSTRWEPTQRAFVWSSKKVHLWPRLTCFWKRPQAAIRGTASSVLSPCEPSASSCVCSPPWALSTKERCSSIRLKKASHPSAFSQEDECKRTHSHFVFGFYRLLQGVWREVWRGEGESRQSGSGLRLQGPDREASVTERWVCVLTAVI